jgi:hypothetical protein
LGWGLNVIANQKRNIVTLEDRNIQLKASQLIFFFFLQPANIPFNSPKLALTLLSFQKSATNFVENPVS